MAEINNQETNTAGSSPAPEQNAPAAEQTAPAKKKKKRNRLTGKQIAVRVLLLAALAGAGYFGYRKYQEAAAQKARSASSSVHTSTAKKMDMVSSLSSSGTLSPKDTYSITSLVSGEIIQADFEEGDLVEEGQVLYVIDASSMESKLHSAENSLERSKTSYEIALSDYNEAVSKYSGNTYKSTETGYISTLYIKEGDKVSNGTKIADVVNDTVMKIRLPFLSTDAQNMCAGMEAVLTLSDTGEQISGSITSVSNMEGTMTGGRLVRYVNIEVANPGGLTTSTSATATVYGIPCAQEGTFEAKLETVMTADLSSSVEVAALCVNEGDYVGKGGAVFRMTDKTADNLIRSYKDTMDKAQESVESAETNLDSTQDSYENYTITAPISGQVITKSMKVGDKINGNSNSNTTLAVIYDLSALTFEMSIDELDISDVKVGQTVDIEADAYENEKYTGTVTNISLQSSYSNGVTNYPVTITLDETGNLLPGMNVDGEIILESEEDALVVPVDALMRGNRVYVKDDSVKEQDGAVPAGFRAVEVTTGLTNDSYVQILSGLSEGDEVYVQDSTVSSGWGNWGGMGGQGGSGGGGGNMGGQGGPGGGGGNMGGGPRG